VEQSAYKTELWKRAAPVLGKLDIELTERCNNNCIHCCINLPPNDKKAKKRELTTKEIKHILKEAVRLDCMMVRFTGGEPLLRKDFEELYVFARKQGLKVLLFTNATLITTRLARLLKRIPPLEKIEVSVYGMRKNSYEAATRVKGSYKAFKRGISLLLKNKIPFVVKGALLPSNKNELDVFEKWAATLPGMGKSPSQAMFFDLRCRRDDETRNKTIRGIRLTPQEGLEFFTRNRARYVKEMNEFCSKFMRPSGDRIFSCGAGCGGCVDAYGYFQPCLMLRHPDMVYNLKEGSLKDALANCFPKLRTIRARHHGYLSRCAKCFLKGLCEQCPAKSCMEHGTLDTPVEYCCEVAHVQARFLGLLNENEKGWEIRDWKSRIKGMASDRKN